MTKPIQIDLGTSPRYPYEAVVRWAFKTLGGRPSGTVKLLDVGAGAGRHSIFLADIGFKITALDRSDTAMKTARKWAAAESLVIETVTGSADDLPFESGSFDVLLCFGVLYYMDDADIVRAVKECHRVLAPGGKLMAVTRTTEDSRFVMGDAKSDRSSVVPGGDDVPWQIEVGLRMCFLTREDVFTLFSAFSRVDVDRLSFTQGGGKYLNDDWVIFATR